MKEMTPYTKIKVHVAVNKKFSTIHTLGWLKDYRPQSTKWGKNSGVLLTLHVWTVNCGFSVFKILLLGALICRTSFLPPSQHIWRCSMTVPTWFSSVSIWMAPLLLTSFHASQAILLICTAHSIIPPFLAPLPPPQTNYQLSPRRRLFVH